MKIDYIKITNFRPYYGTQTIHFSQDPNKNITLIQGNNGSGKTSLINAFTWCLYGEELHNDHSEKDQNLYNRVAANEIEDDTLNVSVEINFYDRNAEGNFVPFNVKRDQTFWRNPSGKLVASDYGSELTITQLIGEDHDITHRSYPIEQKIPEEMHNYFFFNGATLNGYFKSDSEQNLKKSVEEIAQINLISTVKTHVENVEKYYKKEISSKSSNISLGAIGNKISELEDLKEKVDIEYESAKKEKNIAEDNIKRLKAKLRENKHSNVKDLVKTQEILEENVKDLKGNISSTKKEHTHYVLTMYPLVKMFKIFEKSMAVYENGRVKGQVPPLYRKSFLKDLIDDKKCVCGIDLEKNPDSMAELKKRLVKTSDVTDKDISQPIMSIKSIFSDLKKCEDTITKQLKSLYTDEKKLREKLAELKETKDKISGLNINEIDELTEALELNEGLIRKYNHEMSVIESRIDDCNNRLSKLNKEHEQISRMETAVAKFIEKKKFCERAKSFIDNLESIMREDIHKIVETKTREQFTNIEWANNKFEDIEIDENYNISIITKGENNTRTKEAPIPFLSGGERIILALSFMLSLHQITGYDLPIVIDAPFEQLDTDKRHDIVKQLPETTQSKQVTLLVTNTQYTPSVQKALSEYIGKEYKLEDKGLKTEVHEYARN
ncbi:MAG: AAA family ATPase [Methanobacteriaceae archaeon]|nr:AAA family ATPase [Methanobacteriaceae archaeon]